MSRVFYARAKSLLSFDMLGRGSIGLVQALLLMGQYLQSTESSGLCWNVVGLAIRVAQRIGLHLGPSDSTHGYATCGRSGGLQGMDQMEIEIRRRV